ncbi:MAG: AbrB family transcriptional regulator [Armatimonadota bacterium]|nr:AbrB family transcriptional regulator [Armatimonadota bacterium]MDW8156510.1 AbrB family transcriptional regulator [Armatimonadota bacterium]
MNADQMVATAVVVAAGVAGGVVGIRLRLPAGALLGGLLGSLAALSLLPVQVPAVDPSVRRWLQIAVGITLGSRVRPDTLPNVRRASRAAFVVVLVTLVGAVGGAELLRWAAGLDRGTALLAATPGGMPEMILLALALDRPVDLVTTVQLVRVVTTLVVTLPLVRWWLRRLEVSG